MREIKFRAWDTWRKEIFLDEENDYLSFSFNEKQNCFGFMNETKLSDMDNNRFILQQWTGLKDKNGKEIYEGDIVKILGEPIPFEVVFNQVLARFQFGSHAIRELSPLNHLEEDELLLRKIEVIGNIWENPELLEVKE